VNKKDIQLALQRVRDESKSRKFQQTVDMIINFRGLDIKKPEAKIELEVTLPHATGKKADLKVAAFVQDKNFASQLKEKKVKVIMVEEIPKLKKKEVEQLLSEYSAFLAEGPAMLEVGKHMGQQLAPKGRMPTPITASVSVFDSVLGKISTSTKITNKKGKVMPLVQITIGNEKSKPEELLENIETVYENVVAKLPAKEHNIKSTILKYTMGPPIKIGEAPKAEVAEAEVKA